MQLVCKVGNKYPIGHPNYLTGWKDGQLIEIREGGTLIGKREAKSLCIIETPDDYWTTRGSMDWKSIHPKVMNFKKLWSVPDSNGRYKWERFFLGDESKLRKRDRFIDFKWLLDNGYISQGVFDSIYNKDVEQGNISMNIGLDNYLFNESIKNRLVSPYSTQLGSVATGTFAVGSGLDYSTWTLAEADIAATLTGNLTFEGNDEETSISTDVRFDTDTATFLLKLTAQAGDEHDGTAYGNGARITMTAGDSFELDETTAGHLADVEVSKLAFDITGNNIGVNAVDCGGAGNVTLNRLLIAGDGNSPYGIRIQAACSSSGIINNTVYGCGDTGNQGGIVYNNITSSDVHVLYNNTCAKNYNNINYDNATMTGTLTVKNNLCQGDTGGGDFGDGGGGFGTTAKNISEDATSPDVAGRSLNMHDGTSNFTDYTNNNYLIASGGDAIATLKAGEDLTGTFTDSITGLRTRTSSQFFIGSDWISVAAGATYERTVADGAKFGDTLVNTMGRQGVVADGAKFGDTPAGMLTLLMALTDGVKFGDTPVNIATLFSSLTDGVDFGDVTINIATLLSVISDGVVFGDTNVNIATLLSVISDGVDFGDVTVTIVSKEVTVVDGVVFGDTPINIATLLAVLTDGIEFGDVTINIATLVSSVADGIVLGDSLVTAMILLASVIDGAKFGDTGLAGMSFSVSIADGVEFGDAVLVGGVFDVVVADGITLGDVLTTVGVITGMTITFTVKEATVTFTVRSPSPTFTVKEAETEFTVKLP